jgi:hypothetical protein
MNEPGVGSPFSSLEVRWFFDGNRSERDAIARWFGEHSPVVRSDDVGAVEWKGRKGDEPDTYLLLPGYDDMGIKWREGSLQIKGLVSDVGRASYGGHHEGRVQRWIKWSFSDVPAVLRTLFQDEEPTVVPVGKTRAVRLVEIGHSGEYTEVPSSKWVRQGIAFEMTDLQLGSEHFYTIAFEAFPDSTSLREHFDRVVEGFLVGLKAPDMDLARSMSYPAWLNGKLA